MPFRGLRDRPPVAVVATGPQQGLLGAAFGQLRQTLRHARSYPQTLLFLIAYLFYNDGIQTVIYAASIYGSRQLGLAEHPHRRDLGGAIRRFAGALLLGRVAGRRASEPSWPR